MSISCISRLMHFYILHKNTMPDLGTLTKMCHALSVLEQGSWELYPCAHSMLCHRLISCDTGWSYFQGWFMQRLWPEIHHSHWLACCRKTFWSWILLNQIIQVSKCFHKKQRSRNLPRLLFDSPGIAANGYAQCPRKAPVQTTSTLNMRLAILITHLCGLLRADGACPLKISRYLRIDGGLKHEPEESASVFRRSKTATMVYWVGAS